MLIFMTRENGYNCNELDQSLISESKYSFIFFYV